jgi:hypothetical protein
MFHCDVYNITCSKKKSRTKNVLQDLNPIVGFSCGGSFVGGGCIAIPNKACMGIPDVFGFCIA